MVKGNGLRITSLYSGSNAIVLATRKRPYTYGHSLRLKRVPFAPACALLFALLALCGCESLGAMGHGFVDAHNGAQRASYAAEQGDCTSDIQCVPSSQNYCAKRRGATYGRCASR